MRIVHTKDLTPIRDAASARIDADAEAARLRYLTGGEGQALEYQATQAECAAASAAPDPLDPSLYPFLVAERQAQLAAGRAGLTLRQVVGEVQAQVDAWVQAGAAIKEARRLAKLRIAAAASEAEVDAIVAGVTWPIPAADQVGG